MPRDFNQRLPYRYIQLLLEISGDSTFAKLHRLASPMRSTCAARLVTDDWLTSCHLQLSNLEAQYLH